jgi:hypothetical protein
MNDLTLPQLKRLAVWTVMVAVAAGAVPKAGAALGSGNTAPRSTGESRKDSPNTRLPSFKRVEHVVAAQLGKTSGYERNDLLSKRDVQPLFRQLANIGWKVSDQQAILQQVLHDDHPLVQELRTPEGRKFMRRVSGQASIYDRLDRLSQDERGRESLRTLIRLPNDKLFGHATANSQVSNMSDLVQLIDRGNANRRGTKDLDKPTGRIYTADDLLERLRQSHQAAEAGRSR